MGPPAGAVMGPGRSPAGSDRAGSLLTADVRRGRELLARHLAPVVMTPDGARRYHLRGAPNLSTCLSALAPGRARASGKDW